MKKIIILALCMMLLFTACSSKEPADVTTEATTSTSETIPENYVGDATLETLKTLVNMHVIIETEYLEKSHPTIDMTKTVEHNGLVYALVTDGRFKNYTEFENAIRDTYTKESANFLLNDFETYINVGGAIYFNTDLEYRFAEGRYPYDWSNFTIQTVDVKDNEIAFNVFIKYSTGDVAAIRMTAYLEDGNWRIAN